MSSQQTSSTATWATPNTTSNKDGCLVPYGGGDGDSRRLHLPAGFPGPELLRKGVAPPSWPQRKPMSNSSPWRGSTPPTEHPPRRCLLGCFTAQAWPLREIWSQTSPLNPRRPPDSSERCHCGPHPCRSRAMSQLAIRPNGGKQPGWRVWKVMEVEELPRQGERINRRAGTWS
jgi:hypothetical protein